MRTAARRADRYTTDEVVRALSGQAEGMRATAVLEFGDRRGDGSHPTPAEPLPRCPNTPTACPRSFTRFGRAAIPR